MLTIDDIRRANLKLILGEQTATALGAKAEISPSLISQWKNASPDSKTGKPRQISSESCRKIEKAIGRENGWMDQHHWPHEQHPSRGTHLSAHEPAPAQYVSHPKFEDAPTVIAWERILTEPLKAEFQTLMPDASMEPDVPRGARVIFVTGIDVEPGDWALVRDPDGHLYLRVIRQLKPGRWEAHALNPAFLPMDSERDGLVVVAVFDGVRGRKARV